MKIAHFSDNFYPELSGITDSIINLTRELARRGHEILICAPNYSAKNFRQAGLEPRELDLGPRARVLRLFALPFPGPTQQTRAVIPMGAKNAAILAFKPDIVQAHHFFGAGLEARRIARRLGKPLVGTNHTPITEFMKYGPLRTAWLDRAARHYVSRFYNHCAYVTAPSRLILEEMRTYGLTRPHEVISNPIDLENFFPVTAEKKQSLKRELSLSDRTVLYTGRLAEEKHIDVLIRAIAIVKQDFTDVRLAITGHGVARSSLEKLAADLGVKEQVRFFGTVDPATLTKVYQAADVFAIASTAEMQSISLMNAMASRLPVIGVKAWALDEYINQANGFKVAVGDYRALAEKIISLFKNPVLAERLGRGGVEFVKNFSVKAVTDRWEKLYGSLIKPK